MAVTTTSLFVPFPKLARWSREVVITEKIDGTNAAVVWVEDADLPDYPALAKVGSLNLYCQSRTRLIAPADDNFGFARWAVDHAEELAGLGAGRHFGEWWGPGIQREYGMATRRFSLFNVARWHQVGDAPFLSGDKSSNPAPGCCHVVPVLGRGVMDDVAPLVERYLSKLALLGSVASPGFMRPEGIVVYHTAAGVAFKKTFEHDKKGKGE